VCGIDPGDQGESCGGGAATYWSPELHRLQGRMTAPSGARCGFTTNRDRENREYEENQKLTTMPRSWSERSQEVGQGRSPTSSHRNAELVGDDWERSSSIGLTRR
jgi:hypothetical protein